MNERLDSNLVNSRVAAVITVSDSRSRAVAVDTATAELASVFEDAGWQVAQTVLIADDKDRISTEIKRCCDQGCALVVTTGGTGLGPRDVTPEATMSVIERTVPGIVEMFRLEGAKSTSMSWLSRGVAGTYKGTLIANLPGNPRGASECLTMLLPLAEHAIHVLSGGGHDD